MSCRLAALWLILAATLTVPLSAAAAEQFEHEGGHVSFAAPPERVVTLDWGLAETLLALGVTPVGVADVPGYEQWVGGSTLPEAVVDVGRRLEPSLELIDQLAPDLILITSQFQHLRARLERVAPTMVLSTFRPGQDPLQRLREITRLLGDVLDREARARDLLRELDAALSRTARELAAETRRRPLLLLGLQDHRHVSVYGEHSLYDSVLERVGLGNAWPRPVGFWGVDTVGVERLAEAPEAIAVLIEPIPAAVRARLGRSPLWQHMPFVREGRVRSFPAVWAFGGIPSVMRFARLLRDVLSAGDRG